MKGIILAGGSGTRLHPFTKFINKHLLPIYDKPMIYYPLNTLIHMGIKDIMIITSKDRKGDYYELLGNGHHLDVNLSYEIQLHPNGIAEAFLIAEKFIGTSNVTLVLGDNIFDNHSIANLKEFKSGALIFAKKVFDPKRFGVVQIDNHHNAISIEEKPQHPKSNLAVTGLYVYDNQVVNIAKTIKPGKRHELEITDVNQVYLKKKQLKVVQINGEWIDAGTFDSLLKAGIAAKNGLREQLTAKIIRY